MSQPTEPSPRSGNPVDRFLQLMQDRGASDLHLSVGRPPIFRQSGRIEPIRYRVLDDNDFIRLIEPITPPHLWKKYVESGDTDFAYEVPGLARFRVNLFKQERGMGGVFRIIPTKIMTLDQLGMPDSGEGSAPIIDRGAYETQPEAPGCVVGDVDCDGDGITVGSNVGSSVGHI